jgi:1-acyl-sn-glycerol-3-phosphate acyltransferase
LATPPFKTLIAAVRSLATYIGISLYVLVCAPPGLLLAFVFGWNGALYVLGHGGVRLGLLLSGIRCSVTGLERVPRDRAVVFCANHQSNVDPPILFTLLHRRLHILFKAELLKLPLLGRVFLAGGFVPVVRENREQAMASIAAGAASLQAGHSFLIFPEGTRSRTSELLPFKKGGFIMALTAQAPVVPVAIHGGRAAMRKGSHLVWPAQIRIAVGEPIETHGRTLQERDRLIAETRERIAAMLPPPDTSGPSAS